MYVQQVTNSVFPSKNGPKIIVLIVSYTNMIYYPYHYHYFKVRFLLLAYLKTKTLYVYKTNLFHK